MRRLFKRNPLDRCDAALGSLRSTQVGLVLGLLVLATAAPAFASQNGREIAVQYNVYGTTGGGQSGEFNEDVAAAILSSLAARTPKYQPAYPFGWLNRTSIDYVFRRAPNAFTDAAYLFLGAYSDHRWYEAYLD